MSPPYLPNFDSPTLRLPLQYIYIIKPVPDESHGTLAPIVPVHKKDELCETEDEDDEDLEEK